MSEHEIESPELPEINPRMFDTVGGYDGDLERMLGVATEASTERDVPIPHPRDDAANATEISDEEYEQSIAKKFGAQQLFKMNHKLRAEYGSFDISDASQCQDLENMVNNCLQKGWLLAREEWTHTPDGKTIVGIKCLIPEKRKKTRRGGKNK